MSRKDNKLIYEAYARGSEPVSITDLISPDVPTDINSLVQQIESKVNPDRNLLGVDVTSPYFQEVIAPAILEWFKSSEVSVAGLVGGLEAEGPRIPSFEMFQEVLQKIKFGENLQAARQIEQKQEQELDVQRQQRRDRPGRVYTHTPRMG
jgi:hypothetical protein